MSSRDAKGGALFHITPDNQKYPLLVIRVTNDFADIHFFPYESHPGFRCLGGEGLPHGGWSSFVYQGSDPSSGEETPNKFIVPFLTAFNIAVDFLSTGEKTKAAEWLEL